MENSVYWSQTKQLQPALDSVWNFFIFCLCVCVPQYGLYSAFMGGFIYTLLGTSKDITLGPTAIMSLLCFPVVEGQPSRAVLLTLLTGIIQAAMALLRLGERPCENLVTGASLIWVSRPLEMNLPARHFYSLDFFARKNFSGHLTLWLVNTWLWLAIVLLCIVIIVGWDLWLMWVHSWGSFSNQRSTVSVAFFDSAE